MGGYSSPLFTLSFDGSRIEHFPIKKHTRSIRVIDGNRAALSDAKSVDQ
jgi:hypothetical protein